MEAAGVLEVKGDERRSQLEGRRGDIWRLTDVVAVSNNGGSYADEAVGDNSSK